MRTAHPLEIRTMFGRRRPDRLGAAMALEIERDGQAAAVEPDEGLVVGREDGRVGKVSYDREQLSEVGRDGARLRVPPPALEALQLIVEVPAYDQGAEQRDGNPHT